MLFVMAGNCKEGIVKNGKVCGHKTGRPIVL